MDVTQPAANPAASSAGGARIWPADPASFSTHRISAIRHDFHAHPMLQLPALQALAHGLAATGQCRFIRPGATQGAPFEHDAQHPGGRDIDEVFRRIEEPGSWIALYNVETHPAARAFIEEVTRSVLALAGREQPGVHGVGGFIFISAPPSVTPFHIDRENNFWLQVRGRKEMSVWDPADREVVAGADVDRFIATRSLENVRLKEASLARRHVFDVGPGEGVYFPSLSPHMTRSEPSWATPGDGVSISIGIVFFTEHTRRRAHLHFWNHALRRLGLSPRDAGDSGLVDRLKSRCGRTLLWAKKTFRGFKPLAGM